MFAAQLKQRLVSNASDESWHRHHGTPKCGKAKREMAWYAAEKVACHVILDYQPTKNMGGYQCGEYDEYEMPSGAHYGWHKSHGTEPCGKARAEIAWKVAGGDPGWEPAWPATYECGPRSVATGPSYSHYEYHRHRGEDPC